VVLAYFLLKEKLKRFEIVLLFLILGGIVTVILGEEKETDQTEDSSKKILYIFLLCNPFLIGGGSVAMRKMKKFH